MSKFDIDIDVNDKVDRALYGRKVAIYNEEQKKLLPHPSGVILSDIPIDPETGLVPFHYKEIEDKGVHKVDILKNHSYDVFSSKQQIYDLLDKTELMDWKWVQDKEFVEQLPHLKGNYHYLTTIVPESVEELADTIALIRPGKIHLIPDYCENKRRVRKVLYKRPVDGKMYMKKSHAIAYALMIVVIALHKKNKRDRFSLA